MTTIKLYTTNTCSYCKMVKRWLDSKGHKYQTINLDDNPAEQDTIYQKSGALTVPVTLIETDGKEDVVIGFNLPRLSTILS